MKSSDKDEAGANRPSLDGNDSRHVRGTQRGEECVGTARHGLRHRAVDTPLDAESQLAISLQGNFDWTNGIQAGNGGYIGKLVSSWLTF